MSSINRNFDMNRTNGPRNVAQQEGVNQNPNVQGNNGLGILGNDVFIPEENGAPINTEEEELTQELTKKLKQVGLITIKDDVGLITKDDLERLETTIARNGTGTPVIELVKYFIITENFSTAKLFLKVLNEQPINQEEIRQIVIRQYFPLAKDKDIADRLIFNGANLPDYLQNGNVNNGIAELKDVIDNAIAQDESIQIAIQHNREIEDSYYKTIAEIKNGKNPSNEDLLTITEYIEKSDPPLAEMIKKKASGEKLSLQESAMFEGWLVSPDDKEIANLWAKKSLRHTWGQVILDGKTLPGIDPNEVSNAGRIPMLTESQDKKLFKHMEGLVARVEKSKGEAPELEKHIKRFAALRQDNIDRKIQLMTLMTSKDERAEAWYEIEEEQALLITDKAERDAALQKARIVRDEGVDFLIYTIPFFIEKLNDIKKSVGEQQTVIEETIAQLEEARKNNNSQADAKTVFKLKEEINKLRDEVARYKEFLTSGKDSLPENIKFDVLASHGLNIQELVGKELLDQTRKIVEIAITRDNFHTPNEKENIKEDINRLVASVPKNVIEEFQSKSKGKDLKTVLFNEVSASLNRYTQNMTNPSSVQERNKNIAVFKQYDNGKTKDLLAMLDETTKSLNNIDIQVTNLRAKSTQDIFANWGIDGNRFISSEDLLTTEKIRDIDENIKLFNSLSPKDRAELRARLASSESQSESTNPYEINPEQVAVQIASGVLENSSNNLLLLDLKYEVERLREEKTKELSEIKIEHEKLQKDFNRELFRLNKLTEEGVPWYEDLLESFGHIEALDEGQGIHIKQLIYLKNKLAETTQKMQEKLDEINQIELAQLKHSVAEKQNTGLIESSDEQLIGLLLKKGPSLKYADEDLWNEVFRVSTNPAEQGVLQRLEETGQVKTTSIRSLANTKPKYSSIDEALYTLKENYNKGTNLDNSINTTLAFHTIDNAPDFANLQRAAIGLNETLPTLQKLLAAANSNDAKRLDNLVSFMQKEGVALGKVLDNVNLDPVKKDIIKLQEFLATTSDPKLKAEISKRLEAMNAVVSLFENKEIRKIVDFIRDKSQFNKNDWAGWWDSGEGKAAVGAFVVAVAAVAITVGSMGTGTPFSAVLITSSAVSAGAGLVTSEAIKEAEYQFRGGADENGLTFSSRSKAVKWIEEKGAVPKDLNHFIELTNSFQNDVTTPYTLEFGQNFIFSLITMGLSRAGSTAISKGLQKAFITNAGQRFAASNNPIMRRIVSKLSQIEQMPGSEALKKSFMARLTKSISLELIDESGDELKEHLLLTAVESSLSNLDKRTSVMVSLLTSVIVGSSKGLNAAINQPFMSMDNITTNLKNEGHSILSVENGKIKALAFDGVTEFTLKYELDSIDPTRAKITGIDFPTAGTIDLENNEFLNSLPEDIQTQLKESNSFITLPINTKIGTAEELPVDAKTTVTVDTKTGERKVEIKLSSHVFELLNSDNADARAEGLNILQEEITHAHQRVLNPADYKSESEYLVARFRQEIGGEASGARGNAEHKQKVKDLFTNSGKLIDEARYDEFIFEAKKMGLLTDKDAARFKADFNQTIENGIITQSFYSVGSVKPRIVTDTRSNNAKEDQELLELEINDLIEKAENGAIESIEFTQELNELYTFARNNNLLAEFIEMTDYSLSGDIGKILRSKKIDAELALEEINAQIEELKILEETKDKVTTLMASGNKLESQIILNSAIRESNALKSDEMITHLSEEVNSSSTVIDSTKAEQTITYKAPIQLTQNLWLVKVSDLPASIRNKTKASVNSFVLVDTNLVKFNDRTSGDGIRGINLASTERLPISDLKSWQISPETAGQAQGMSIGISIDQISIYLEINESIQTTPQETVPIPDSTINEPSTTLTRPVESTQAEPATLSEEITKPRQGNDLTKNDIDFMNMAAEGFIETIRKKSTDINAIREINKELSTVYTIIENMNIDRKEFSKMLRRQIYDLASDINAKAVEVINGQIYVNTLNIGTIDYAQLYRNRVIQRLENEFNTNGKLSEDSQVLAEYYGVDKQYKPKLKPPLPRAKTDLNPAIAPATPTTETSPAPAIPTVDSLSKAIPPAEEIIPEPAMPTITSTTISAVETSPTVTEPSSKSEPTNSKPTVTSNTPEAFPTSRIASKIVYTATDLANENPNEIASYLRATLIEEFKSHPDGEKVRRLFQSLENGDSFAKASIKAGLSTVVAEQMIANFLKSIGEDGNIARLLNDSIYVEETTPNRVRFDNARVENLITETAGRRGSISNVENRLANIFNSLTIPKDSSSSERQRANNIETKLLGILNPNQTNFEQNLEHMERLARLSEKGIILPEKMVTNANVSSEHMTLISELERMIATNTVSTELNGYVTLSFARPEFKTLAENYSNLPQFSKSKYSTAGMVVDFLNKRATTTNPDHNQALKDFIANITKLGSSKNGQSFSVFGFERLFDKVRKVDQEHPNNFYELASGHYYTAERALDKIKKGHLV